LLPAERRSGAFRCEHNVLCMRQEGEAVLGQGRLPRRSVQKPGPELSLERRQSGARARRSEAQIAGSRADAPKPSDAHEQMQVVDVHRIAFNGSLKLILEPTRYRRQSREVS
jgi:hypothetical protein